MKLAIIGMGPRGLAALEKTIEYAAQSKNLKDLQILIFEKSQLAGYGHVYDINQADTNWINITERALKNLEGRDAINFNGGEIPSIKKYMDSQFAVTNDDSEQSPDIFPRRSVVGQYLKLRFDSLRDALKKTGILTIIQQEVINLNSNADKIYIATEDETVYSVDEALITIGHQPTEIDDQLLDWREESTSEDPPLLFEETYPISLLKKEIDINKHQKIAIRGFGLAAIDAIRALVDLYDGTFKSKSNQMDILSYSKGKKELTIIPFSLDGLPSVPKPYNLKVDKNFLPSDKQLDALETDISKAIKNRPENHLFLANRMAALISEMYLTYQQNPALNSEQINIALVEWILNDSVTEQFMTPPNLHVLDVMKLHVEMAEGKTMSNLDYFAGQVWRHCQPMFYKQFSHSILSDKVMTEIIKIDERIKRYSYGPPVASMKQLILLAEAGTLDLSFIEDPDIRMNNEGWTLSKDDQEIVCTCMINSVIDSPQILKITSPIIKNLLIHDVIKPVHREFGLEISENGQIVSPEDCDSVPIYILGRIAKGSVMGVDAILECFGERIDFWAKGFAARLSRKHPHQNNSSE